MFKVQQKNISFKHPRSFFVRKNRKNNKTKPTLLLARVSPFDFSPLIISKSLNIPIVAEWNTPFFHEIGVLRNGSLILFIKYWERKFLQSCDMIYTVSNEIKNLIINEYDLPKYKFNTIPNGYDSELYPATSQTLNLKYQKIRLKFGWTNKFVIAFVGSLKTWHGINNLINIAKYFSLHDQSIQFLIIGDGETRQTLKKASNELKNITWMGFLHSSLMAEYLIGSDIGIMPYQHVENFYFSPLKLYDMIGACLPSIGCAIGQIAEVYNQYPETGWGVNKGTPNEYIALIIYLQRNKNEVLMKKKLLIKSRTNHTWKKRVDKLIDLIQPLSRNQNDIYRKAV
jgi:glycosyltransferase involved in cell wall biosynthesis